MTEPLWYLRHYDGKEHGPFSLEQLIEAAKAGNIASDSEVSHAKHTKGQWVNANRVKLIGAALAGNVAPESPPIEQGGQQESENVAFPEINSVEARRHPRRQRMKLEVPSTLGAAFFAVFDFRFRYFVTPWIIRVFWGLTVFVMLAFLLLMVFVTVLSPAYHLMASAMPDAVSTEANDYLPERGLPYERPAAFDGPGWTRSIAKFVRGGVARVFGLAFLIVSAAATLLWIRLVLETSIVLFRMAEDLSETKEFAGQLVRRE
jgi:hypothetical protein